MEAIIIDDSYDFSPQSSNNYETSKKQKMKKKRIVKVGYYGDSDFQKISLTFIDEDEMIIESNKNLWRRVGAVLMGLFPFEARTSLAKTKDEITQSVLPDYKEIGISSFIGTAVFSIFNVSIIIMLLAIAFLAFVDGVLGIFPKPEEFKKFNNKNNGPLDRLHMFGYLVFILVVMSLAQVAIMMVMNIADPEALKQFSNAYPAIYKYISHFTLQTFTLMGITYYYLKRIKTHLYPILGRKKETTN
ncbi:hypothetical protein DN407_29310 (plasmid) [Bacillus sp. JAS24-2]|uniref:hypothetical protein n=1 Tax=Bacillus sp. JAS24-2 TaxID=2217832 RepID=UPI0011ED5E23|nr:hypothetical protein [Bacillus sp. JAS24-2]QEL82598.1 hypothetical protein DN407_29310 [Bacillus sp. JAS24-2]